MPTIKIAQEAGACYGVERALDLVEKTLASHSEAVYTLGPLIHNPQVVESYEKRGVTVVDSCDLPQGSVLVLRTHGVTPQLVEDAQKRGLTCVDATCPFVTKTHIAAEKLFADRYEVVVVGESGHPEIVATCAHAPGAQVVANKEEALALKLGPKVGVIAQTTLPQTIFDEVVGALQERIEDLAVLNTICLATSGHQSAAANLASECDVCIVVGGKNSANTRRLTEVCIAICPNTYHIETSHELRPEWFSAASTIGVTGGASTPSAQIEAVCSAIRELTEPVS